MKRLIREPLLHFLLIGLALFLLYGAVSGGRGGADRRIVISDAAIATIVQRHQGVWQRPPTPAELRGLIESQVREEIMFREGVALGLDRGDPVIRRRVQQKVDVIAEEAMARAAPTKADLAAYLDRNAERYALPTLIGVDQAMFDPVRRGAALDADVAAALARLRAGARLHTVGDSSLLPMTIAALPADLLARDLGEDFAKSVLALPVGEWSGPVRSGYGVHLVRVTSRIPGGPARLADVHAAVERDWESERRVRANEDFYAKLRSKYEVIIGAAVPDGSVPKAGR